MNSRTLLALLGTLLCGVLVAVFFSLRAGETARHARPVGEALSSAFDAPSTSPAARTLAEGVQPDAAESRASTESAVVCRVIDDARATALQGFWAQWNRSDGASGDTVSDVTGRFLVPPPRPLEPSGVDSVGLLVSVNPPWGWTMVVRTQQLVPRADGGFDELVFRARPTRFGALRARVVDAETGEAAPNYTLRVGTRDGLREQVTSDARGEFTTTREYPEGRLLLFFHDVEPGWQGSNEERLCHKSEIEHDPRVERPVELAIPVGPTLRFDLIAPVELQSERLVAWLSLAQVPRTLRLSGNATSVRGRDPRWARFRPRAVPRVRQTTDWVLAVATLDGAWYGETPIESTLGIHPGTLAITLDARCSVRGVVREATGESIAAASVQLGPAQAIDERSSFFAAKSGGNGLFEFEMVPAGRYTLDAGTNEHVAARLDLDLRGGEAREVELVLARARPVGALAGRLVAAQASDGEVLTVYAGSRNPSLRQFEQHVRLAKVGEKWQGEFRFDALPAGDYELTIGDYGWSPVEIRASPPNESLVFERSSSRQCLRINALDAESGEALEQRQVVLLSRGSEASSQWIGGEYGCAEYFGELESDARWIAAAEGYPPHWGTRAEISAVEDGYIARPRLGRGWGIEIVALGPGFAPLEGAEIALDGELGEATDRDGIARVVREQRPRSIEVRRAGWSIDPSSAVALRVALQQSHPRAVVFMAPR